jgi:hypothetical protein
LLCHDWIVRRAVSGGKLNSGLLDRIGIGR